jgi:hypothetical protein
MSLRDTLRKAASLLVELPPEETPVAAPVGTELRDLLAELESETSVAPPPPARPRTVEQVVREADGPNLGDIAVSASAPPPVIGAEGSVDFSALYRHADLPSAPFTAEQMLDMLASLPPELPLDTKRQTVTVTLSSIGKSIGATPETIVADASRKLAALVAYQEGLSHQTAESVSRDELEIAALQAKIEAKRAAIQAAQRKLQEVTHVCSVESDRLDDVLEFFSLDVPPSKYAK